MTGWSEDRLRAIRVALGLTQGQLGDILGVGERAVSNYECGRRLAPPHAVMRLKQMYGVSLDFLYAGDLSGTRRDLADQIIRHLSRPA